MAKKISVPVEVKGGDKAKSDLKDIGSAASDAGSQMGFFGGAIGKLMGLFTMLKGVVTTATVGLKGFKLALAATGIGLILLALGSLVALFTSTKRGADSLAQTMAGLGAGVDVLTDRLSGLGEALLTVTDFSAGIDALKKAFTGLGDEMSREIKLAQELEKASQKLQDREISFIATRAESRKIVAELRLAAEDDRLSTETRIKSIDRAIQIQRLQLNEEVKQAQEAARIHKEKIAQGESSREDERELEELKAKVFEKQAERFTLEKSLISRRRGLIKEAESEEKRLITERDKKRDESLKLKEERLAKEKAADEKAAAEKKLLDEKVAAEEEKAKKIKEQLEKNLNILINELRLDDIGKELHAVEMKKQARIKLATEAISDLKELKKIIEEIEKDSATKIDDIKEDFAEKERVRQQKLADEIKQRNKEIIASAIETGQNQLNMLQGFQDLKQQQSQNEFDFNTQLREEDFTNETASLESRLLNINETLDAKNLAETVALEKRILNEKLSDFQINKEKKLLEIKQNKDRKLAEINERKLKEGLEISQIKRENEAIKARNKVKKEEFESNKKLAIAETIISGAMAAISAFRSMASIPVVGPALGIVAAAAVAIFTAAQVSTISKSKFTGGAATIPVPPKTDFAAQAAKVETESELATAGVNALKAPEGKTSGAAGTTGGGFGAGGAGTGVDVPGVLCPQCPSFETEGDEVFGAGGAGSRQRTIKAIVSERDITETQERLRKFEERAEID